MYKTVNPKNMTSAGFSQRGSHISIYILINELFQLKTKDFKAGALLVSLYKYTF